MQLPVWNKAWQERTVLFRYLYMESWSKALIIWACDYIQYSCTAERLMRSFSVTLSNLWKCQSLARTKWPPQIYSDWMHRKPFSHFLPQSFVIKIHKKFLSQCLHTPVNMSNEEIMTRDPLFTCSSLKNGYKHTQRLRRIYTALILAHIQQGAIWTNFPIWTTLTIFSLSILSKTMGLLTQGAVTIANAIIT